MALRSETRNVPGTRAVTLRGVGSLEIEQKPDAAGQETVVVEADEAVIDRIATEVRDGRLDIGFRMPWYEWLTWGWQWLFAADKRIRFHLVAAAVESIAISGAGRTTAGRLASNSLEVAISGAGNIALADVTVARLVSRLSGAGNTEVSGTAEQHDVHISGVGSVKASGLATKRTTATISGSGSLKAAVSEELDVSISGAGNVTYTGSPRVSQRVSGAGSVRPNA